MLKKDSVFFPIYGHKFLDIFGVTEGSEGTKEKFILRERGEGVLSAIRAT